MNRIYKFGWRPVLFMGADRELTLLTGLVCSVIIFYSFALIPILFALLVFFLSLYFFRLMAKTDPLMRKIYLKHIHYQSFYLAKSSIFCVTNRIYK